MWAASPPTLRRALTRPSRWEPRLTLDFTCCGLRPPFFFALRARGRLPSSKFGARGRSVVLRVGPGGDATPDAPNHVRVSRFADLTEPKGVSTQTEGCAGQRSEGVFFHRFSPGVRADGFAQTECSSTGCGLGPNPTARVVRRTTARAAHRHPTVLKGSHRQLRWPSWAALRRGPQGLRRLTLAKRNWCGEAAPNYNLYGARKQLINSAAGFEPAPNETRT